MYISRYQIYIHPDLVCHFNLYQTAMKCNIRVFVISCTYNMKFQMNIVAKAITNKCYFLSLFQTKAHLDVLADAILRWARGR